MAASPAYAATPHNGWCSLTAANNTYTGIGTVGTCLTAGASGGFAGFVRCKPLGTNVATVARFFLNNGADNTVATNNSLLGELTLPATTASATAALTDLVFPLNFAMEPSHTINVALGTAVAAGWAFTGFAGDL
jgi:hypothetical protein